MSFAHSNFFVKFERYLWYFFNFRPLKVRKHQSFKSPTIRTDTQKKNYPGEKLLCVSIQWHLLLVHDMINGNIPWKNTNILFMCYFYRI